MDEIDLFERERKVLEAANELLTKAADNKNSWYEHYEKLLSEFERVVNQSKRLIRLGDMMQLKLNTLNEKFRIEVENHQKTQAEKDAFQTQLFQSQKMEAIGTLVGGIAHDFNNMLQVILGYSEILLCQKKKGEPGYEELQTVIDTGHAGADLVKKLLAFNQQGRVFLTPLDLNYQINELTNLISRALPHLVQIDLELADGPLTILGDHRQIDQVVMNLAINASESMPNGGSLKIVTQAVMLDEHYCRRHQGVKSGNYAMFSIADTGHGMNEETLSKVFDPFFSTKQRGSTRGTGLGLSVVKGIVQQHDGYITCESEPGKGTNFRVYFPSIQSKLPNGKNVVPSVHTTRTKTILIVDDVPEIAELARLFLTGYGYSVITANSGQEALEIYKARRGEISLVILDLLMPKMSGRDCLVELLKIDPGVKVLIASGYAPGDDLHRDIRSMVKGFLHKPFSIAELLNKVGSMLDYDRDPQGNENDNAQRNA